MSKNISNIVDIHQIDLADQRFKISLSKQDIKALANSIKTTGLISFPLLRPVGNNTFTIISGFNRIKALIKNNVSQTPAVIVPEDTTELDCYKKAIASLAFKRMLTHAELILCIKRLIPLCDIQMIEDMSCDLFNLDLKIKFIQNLWQIGQLPDPCLDLINKEHLTIKSARRLTEFDTQTINIFLDLFSNIKASSSKQLEIITFINEIVARDGISIDSLYHDDQFQNMLLNPDMPLGVKTNEVRLFLYKKRFPAIFNTRQKVQKLINDLKLGNTIKLTPPENFEGTNYLVSFTVKNTEDLKAHIEKLHHLSEDKTLEQIFKP